MKTFWNSVDKDDLHRGAFDIRKWNTNRWQAWQKWKGRHDCKGSLDEDAEEK